MADERHHLQPNTPLSPASLPSPRRSLDAHWWRYQRRETLSQRQKPLKFICEMFKNFGTLCLA